MALLKILEIPDPRLREKALPVEKVNEDVRQLMTDLFDTMRHVDGVGMAATQVGVRKRVIVVDVGEKREDPSTPLLMANPEIKWASEKIQALPEGCYSVPGVYEKVPRPAEIKVTYLDENNQHQHLHAKGVLAECIHHEIDHLDGVLFIDRVSSLKRSLILRKFYKKQKLR